MPVYCITGTNRGLGLEFARQLSQDPSNTVFALTRDMQRDNSMLKSVCNPNTTHILECDTGDVSSIEKCTKEIIAILRSTKQKIDVLINNAGVNMKSQLDSLQIVPELLL